MPSPGRSGPPCSPCSTRSPRQTAAWVSSRWSCRRSRPAADSPEVKGILGRATYARGGLSEDEGYDWCLYRNQKERADLRLEVRHLSEDYFADFYDTNSKNPNGVRVLDGPPGLVRLVTSGEDGSANAAVLDPEVSLYVVADLDYAEEKRRPVDEDGFAELTRTFAEERAEYHASHG